MKKVLMKKGSEQQEFSPVDVDFMVSQGWEKVEPVKPKTKEAK